MNAPAPGWLPDPTGRHEHRYWDGFTWTSDVSDAGVTSFDPYDQTAQQPQQPQQPLGYGQQGFSGQQGYSSGPYGAQPSSGSGPSTGLLVGLGAAIVVVLIAIVFVVTNKDDDDGDPIATTDDTTTTTEDDTTDTTEDEDDSDDTTDTTDDSDDTLTESDQVIIDGMSAGLLETSNGVLTQEDADCIAEAMYTEIGFERLTEMTADADPNDPLGGFSSEELAEVMDVMLGCVDAETLIDLGYEDTEG